MITMNWSLEEVEERQAIFSTTLVKQFMKKLWKYQNLMLKHGVNVTDSGYGSDIHTTNSNDDDIELVLPENSSAIASCKSFWTFGAQASIVRLFQWVYKIVQRMKAARILYHLDTVPENEIEITITEVAKELSIAFEYQLMMLYGSTEVIKLAKHGVDCLMTYLNSYGSEFTTASLLQAVIEVKPLTGNQKEIIKTREIVYNGKHYCLCWKLWQVLKQPGLRVPVTDNSQELDNEDIARVSLDGDSEEVFLAEIHQSLNDAHVVIDIEEVNYSSELEGQEENDHDTHVQVVMGEVIKSSELEVQNDSEKQSEIDVHNMPDDEGDTIITLEDEMAHKTEDVSGQVKFDNEINDDKDIVDSYGTGQLVDDIKVENSDLTEIDTLQETSDPRWVTFEEKAEDVTISDTNDRLQANSGSFDPYKEERKPCTCAIVDEGDLTSISAISDENNLPSTSAIINEVSLPSAKDILGKSAIIDESNLSKRTINDEGTSLSINEITVKKSISANVIADECSFESTKIIDENLTNTTAIIDHNCTDSVLRDISVEDLQNVNECPSNKGQSMEDSESKSNEEILSKLQSEQQTDAVSGHIKQECPDSESKTKQDIVAKLQSEQRNGAVLAHINDEYPYKFYGCFTPYGAKCRPKVYGFRGPLHAWNEQKGQLDLVFNDKVTVIDCRARHIPFTGDDKHMAYIPKTCCKH